MFVNEFEQISHKSFIGQIHMYIHIQNCLQNLWTRLLI